MSCPVSSAHRNPLAAYNLNCGQATNVPLVGYARYVALPARDDVRPPLYTQQRFDLAPPSLKLVSRPCGGGFLLRRNEDWLWRVAHPHAQIGTHACDWRANEHSNAPAQPLDIMLVFLLPFGTVVECGERRWNQPTQIPENRKRGVLVEGAAENDGHLERMDGMGWR